MDESRGDTTQDVFGAAKTMNRSAWTKKLAAVNLYEGDVQKLIMNYLTVNGLEAATAAFAQETNSQPDMPLESIGMRGKIREAVIGGNIEDAIRYLNKIEPKILDGNPELSFRLKQQQLIQLIEKRDIDGAIVFAQTNLAPCVKAHPGLLPELEASMSLLFFTDLTNKTARKLSGGVAQRQEAASRVDDAILDFYNIERESTLEMLIKNLQCTQERIIQNSQENMGLVSIDKIPTEIAAASPDLLSGPSMCPILVDVETALLTSATVPNTADRAARPQDTSGTSFPSNPSYSAPSEPARQDTVAASTGASTVAGQISEEGWNRLPPSVVIQGDADRLSSSSDSLLQTSQNRGNDGVDQRDGNP